MSCDYLADRIDQFDFALEQSNQLRELSNVLTTLAPTQWFNNASVLEFTKVALRAVAQSNQQPDPFLIFRSQKNPITLSQTHRILVEWLYQTQCIYLGLMIDRYDTEAKPVTNYSFLFEEDNAILILDHISSEYQLVSFQNDSTTSTAVQTNTSLSSLSSDVSSNNNINGGNDITITPFHGGETLPTKDQLDLDVLLKVTPYSPSLAESLFVSLHHLDVHLVDLEMYLSALDLQHTPGSVLSPLQEDYFVSQTLLSISPPTPSTTDTRPTAHHVLEKLSVVDSRFSRMVDFMNQQISIYPTHHTLSPSINLLNRVLSSPIQGRLLSHLHKNQLSHLTSQELTVLKDLMLRLEIDYKNRHNRLLQKMLTQTQTFLFSLKWKYLQLQIQQQLNPATASAQEKEQQVKKAQEIAAKKRAAKEKQNKAKKHAKQSQKPIEDGANEMYDSDEGEDDVNWSQLNQEGVGNNNIHIDNAEYLKLVSLIISKYKATFKLISHLNPLYISDLFLVSNFAALVLGHGNDKQLHRTRAKFQLINHPRMKALGAMGDRGGRLGKY